LATVAQKDLRRVRAEAGKLRQADRRLRAAIVAAHRSGESTRDIAPYADLSHQRVQQILVEERRAQNE
jgi:hypothetical protein